jgi:exportin-1
MAKPQEVLITIDETGMPCKEELTNTENNSMYELLKDLLINLAKLNWNSTRDIIVQKLDK